MPEDKYGYKFFADRTKVDIENAINYCNYAIDSIDSFGDQIDSRAKAVKDEMGFMKIENNIYFHTLFLFNELRANLIEANEHLKKANNYLTSINDITQQLKKLEDKAEQ